VLVYTTISGAVGALVPFASMDDVEFMTTLEMVRPHASFPTLTQADNLAHAYAKHFISRPRSPRLQRILRPRHGCH
jgi:hypothetical protein